MQKFVKMYQKNIRMKRFIFFPITSENGDVVIGYFKLTNHEYV